MPGTADPRRMTQDVRDGLLAVESAGRCRTHAREQHDGRQP